MPTAEKTKSGKWSVRVYDYQDASGKVHLKRFTADTRKEALRMASSYKAGSCTTDITLKQAVDRYIESKTPALSPPTVKAYRSIQKTHIDPSRIGRVKLSKLTSETLQLYVSDLIRDGKSPKTVHNVYGLVTAAVGMFRSSAAFSVTLPALRKPDLHTPTDSEIEQLLGALRGSDEELYRCVLLCAVGPMRRSEACAVRYDDITGDTILVRRARVQDENRNWIYKDVPKTYSSYRAILYPHEVIEALGSGDGYILADSTPGALSNRFDHALKNAGLPHFRLHDTRHYAASILHAIGIPDQYIMARGGWKTDSVMKRVYRDTISDVEQQMDRKAVEYFKVNILVNT